MRTIEKYLNKITRGDSFEMLPMLPDNCVDFAFADPPYGVKKAEWDNAYPQFNFEAELLRVSRKGVAVTPGQEQIATCINRMGAFYKGLHVGHNLNGMTFNKLGFENTIIAVIAGDAIRGQSCFDFVVSGEKEAHPSPKPLQYMLKLISRFTIEGDIVLDPFSGSGTTAVSCHKLNRQFFCIENDIQYTALSQQRLETERSQLDMFRDSAQFNKDDLQNNNQHQQVEMGI